MRVRSLGLVSMGLGLALGLVAGVVRAQAQPSLENPLDRASYAVGVDIGRNFRKQEVSVNPDLLIRGINEGLAGAQIQLSEKELRRVLNGFQAEVRQKMTLNRRLSADENRRKGLAYLEENKSKEGVVTLPSGLQYRVLKAGTGRKPVESDTIECNYRGTLLSGLEFDSTEPDKPAALKMAALIAGWKEAMKLMAEGARWQIVIPSQLAYGDRGVGSDIGPNETLLFEVELVAIK